LLKTACIVFTTDGEWTTPSQCRLLLKKEEAIAIPLLKKIGIKIVSEELRPYQTLLRGDAVGVIPLKISDLCQALDRPSQCLGWHSGSSCSCTADLKMLWEEIVLLRDREKLNPNISAKNDLLLKEISIAPVVGNTLFPCQEAYQADQLTINLFVKIHPNFPFLARTPEFEPLKDLCPSFNVEAAIKVMNSFGEENLKKAWKEGHLDLKLLFGWLENHRQEILEHSQVKQSLRNLVIYPSSGQLHKLKVLNLAGDFHDPVGLTELVDLQELGGRREFLCDLGMSILDFKTYVLLLPEVLGNPDIEVDKRQRVLCLLAKRSFEIKDDLQVRTALISTSLVECTNGSFQKPECCYFNNETVNSCLGVSVFTAVIPSSHTFAFQSLYEWLGVVAEPRIIDLFKRIKEITKYPYAEDKLQLISTIIAHLGERFLHRLHHRCGWEVLPSGGKPQTNIIVLLYWV